MKPDRIEELAARATQDSTGTLYRPASRTMVKDAINVALSEATKETPTPATIRDDALEEAAKILEGGSFFHDDAPDARFAKHAAAAIRRAKSPAATPKGGSR